MLNVPEIPAVERFPPPMDTGSGPEYIGGNVVGVTGVDVVVVVLIVVLAFWLGLVLIS
jgi:hypothetical protein